MKIVLVCSLVVLCAVVFQPAEAARMTRKQSGPLSKFGSILRDAGGYLVDLAKKGWKNVKDLAKTVWEDVQKPFIYLKKSAAKIWPAMEDKLKRGVKDFKKEIGDLRKTAKKLSNNLKDAAHKSLLKVALFIVSKNTPIEEVAKTVEKEVRDIKNMESTILNEILNVPKANECVTECKNQAMSYKNDNLKKYTKCTANAYDAVKTVGEFLFNSAVTVYPNVMQAATTLTAGPLNPQSYSDLVQTLGNIIFTDIPKVFHDGKQKIAKIREDLEKGLSCVIDKFEDAKDKWNVLSKKLATC